MNFDAIKFATRSADTAIDQRDDYRDLQDAIASYRENLVDTMHEHNIDEFDHRKALNVFDNRIDAIRAALNI